MSSSAAAPLPAAGPVRPVVLADVLPRGLARDVALVVGAAGLTGLAAQVSIPLWPVPLTLQTFAVLLSGAALGARRGLAAMSLYLVVGVAGMPWFSAQGSGWDFPSFGYIIGFVLAGALVGAIADRGVTRSPWRTALAMLAGSLVIYAVGVPWLMQQLDWGLAHALDEGMWPFLLGDAIKAVAAAGLLPAAWRLTGR